MRELFPSKPTELVLPRKIGEELLIYLDPGFFSDWGHYNSFAEAIHNESRTRGVDLWHFTTADVMQESAAKFSLTRFFDHRAMLQQEAGFIDSSQAGSGENLTGALRQKWFDRKTAGVLKSFMGRVKVIFGKLGGLPVKYERISLYMYTGHPLHFAALAEALDSPELHGLNIDVHLGLFYLNLDFCRRKKVHGYENLLHWVSEVIENSRGKIKIYADSERTIGLYSPFFKRSILLSPLILDAKELEGKSPSEPADGITVGFFGFAHEKQGYPLFKQLYEYLISRSDLSHLHFIVRHNTKFSTTTVKASVAEFREHADRITHVDGNFLSKEVYDALINRCDIIAIPHSIQHYPCQTSGILTEAIFRNKIVIVPKNTWLADKIKEFGSGATFRSDDWEDFRSSFLRILEDFEAYKSRSGHNVEEFRAFNSVSTLFDILGVGGKKEELH